MDAAPYSVPKEPGHGRAIALAAAVHVALLAFLWIGVQWQNDTPVTVEAEIWSPQLREAAPRAQPEPKPAVKEIVEPVAKPVTKPVSEPIEKPTPKPAPEPTPKPVAKPVEKIAPAIKPIPPDIALEQEKKRKAEKLKEQLEEDRKEKLKKLAEEKRLEKDKQDKQDKQYKKEKQEKKEQQDRQDKLDKQAKDNLKKAELDKKQKQDDADAKKMARTRDEEMRRITGGATGSGGSGDAPKSQGPRGDQNYLQKVGAKIKSNTIFNLSDDLNGNPPVEYAVELLPDGSIRNVKKLKSSGVPGFDEAVRRAIDKSQPFPADKSGTAPAEFILSHKPKD